MKPPVKTLEYNPLTDGVTQSMLTDFLKCREYSRLKLQGWRQPATSQALMYGNCVHNILEEFYTDYGKSQMLVYIASEEARWKTENLDADAALLNMKEVTFAMIEGVLPHYADHWHEKDIELEWLELEKVFDREIEITLANGNKASVRFRGRKDGAYKRSNGLWLLETKTKGRWNSLALVSALALDTQVQSYCNDLYFEYKEWPKGVDYNIIRRPQIKQGKKSLEEYAERIYNDVEERPEFYFERMEVAFTPEDLKRFWTETFIPLVGDFVSCHLGLTPAYRNPTSCTNMYGSCAFLTTCATNKCPSLDASLSLREALFPELEN